MPRPQVLHIWICCALLLLHCAKKRWGREEVVSRLQKMPECTYKAKERLL